MLFFATDRRPFLINFRRSSSSRVECAHDFRCKFVPTNLQTSLVGGPCTRPGSGSTYDEEVTTSVLWESYLNYSGELLEHSKSTLEPEVSVYTMSVYIVLYTMGLSFKYL